MNSLWNKEGEHFLQVFTESLQQTKNLSAGDMSIPNGKEVSLFSKTQGGWGFHACRNNFRKKMQLLSVFEQKSLGSKDCACSYIL
jgi:hypothetical protein